MTSAADRGSIGVAVRAVSLVRNRYFLWNRLAVRLLEGTLMIQEHRNGHGQGVAAAGACVVLDLGLAWLLRRTAGTCIWPRLALDSIDVAGWCWALGGAPAPGVLAASPLACEAAIRSGWRGLVVPAVVGTAASVALFVTHQPLSPTPFLYPLVPTLGGALAIRYLRHCQLAHLRKAADQIEAAASRAELGGQNSIALGADTIIDLLTRTGALLTLGGCLPPASPLDRWRQALAADCARRATYLGVAVARWQRARNSMCSDLRADIDLRCQAGAGTLLLSAAQARHLEHRLHAMRLRGITLIKVPQPAAAGRAQVILVGGRSVTLPPDSTPPADPLDLAPIAFMVAVLAILSQSPPGTDDVPMELTLPLAGIAVGLSWWAHCRLRRLGPAGRGRVLAIATALGATDAVLSTFVPPTTAWTGEVRFPFLAFTVWVGPLLVMYARDLSPIQRGLTVGAAITIVAFGFVLVPWPIPFVALAMAPLWPGTAVLAAVGLRDTLQRDAADLRTMLESRRRAAIDEADRRGRRLVLDLAAAAAAETRTAYLESLGRLPRSLVVEIDRRLAEAEARLKTLDHL
jgi:hypothetical protein